MKLHFSLFGADLKRKFGLAGHDGVEFCCEAGLGRGDVHLGLSKEGLFLSCTTKAKEKNQHTQGCRVVGAGG